MEYSLPRLTRAWGHLSRQGGGLGGKGEGETQLETDRRLVRAQIDRLKSDLDSFACVGRRSANSVSVCLCRVRHRRVH